VKRTYARTLGGVVQNMESYKITLFGHRDLDAHEKVEALLYPLLLNLLRTKPYVEIFIGRNGEFDKFAASLVKRAQKAHGKENSEMILVLPYACKDIEFYESYYDGIWIPECIKQTHPKGAIVKRNRWMVENCDLLICYAEHAGGAQTALQYAQKLKKDYINLA